MLVLGTGLILYLLEQTIIGTAISRLNHGNGQPA
jgi:hypothetical protein